MTATKDTSALNPAVIQPEVHQNQNQLNRHPNSVNTASEAQQQHQLSSTVNNKTGGQPGQGEKCVFHRNDDTPYMYTIPNPYYRHSNWMKSGAEFAGIMIAGRCILAMAFFGFGVLLMGIVMIVVTNCFKNPHAKINYNNRDKDKSPVLLLGPVFLGIGGLIFIISVFFLILAIKSAKKTLVGIADGSEIATVNTLDEIGVHDDGHSSSSPPPYYDATYFPPPEEPFGRDYASSPFPYSAKQPYSTTYSDGQTIAIYCGPLAPAYPPNTPSGSYSISSIFK